VRVAQLGVELEGRPEVAPAESVAQLGVELEGRPEVAPAESVAQLGVELEGRLAARMGSMVAAVVERVARPEAEGRLAVEQVAQLEV